MKKGVVKIDYFFEHPVGFPWDILGLSRPNYAPLHAYLCAAASLCCRPEERHFLESATVRELIRFSEVSPAAADIAKFCLTAGNPTCRFAKARLVIEWMRHSVAFREHMQQQFDSMYRQGLISLPEGAKP